MRSANVLALLCLFATVASTQNAMTERPPTFKSRADLVLVPVQIHSRGTHVAGMQREKFSLLQDGVPQKIALFEEIHTVATTPKRPLLSDREFTNVLENSALHGRFTVIAIDQINTTAADMNRLRDALTEFLSKATLEEQIGLLAVNPSSMRVIHDFTSDRKKLVAALNATTGRSGKLRTDTTWLDETLDEIPSAPTTESGNSGIDRGAGIIGQEQAFVQFQERTQRITSLEALQRIAISMAGLPGHKSLIWVSSGYPFASLFKATRDGSSVAFTPANALGALRLDEYTMQLLNSANVAVYPVDARGSINNAWNDMDPGVQRPVRLSDAERMRDHDVIASFERLASATGGRACYNRVDISRCFREAIADAQNYYLLGYYLDRAHLTPGWHKLSVKVEGDRFTVRFRTGFLGSTISGEELTKRDMALGIRSNLMDTRLPFRGRWLDSSVEGNVRVVPLAISVLKEARLVDMQQPRLNLEVAAIARNSDGSVAAQFAQHFERELNATEIAEVQNAGLTYTNNLKLSPGEYIVRVVIRDNHTGRMGSTSAKLVVPQGKP